MHEEMKLIIGMIGMLIASGLLTWSTQPSDFAPVPSKRKRESNTKLRLQESSILQNGNGRMMLDSYHDTTIGNPDRR